MFTNWFLSAVWSIIKIMIEDFDQLYAKLNSAQQQAVDVTEGAVLVLAGPGTGKTQLLSARILKLLKDTDISPENILCLTFTENAATNMRDRLSQFIGEEADRLAIHTFHSFCNFLIANHKEFFKDKFEHLVTDLEGIEIISDLQANLPNQNLLKNLQPRNLLGLLTQLRKSGLKPSDLTSFAQSERQLLGKMQTELANFDLTSLRGKANLPVMQQNFAQFLAWLQQQTSSLNLTSVLELMANSLAQALLESEELESTSPLTAWRNSWLAPAKPPYNHKDFLAYARLIELSDIYDRYEKKLESVGGYTFDDLLIKTVEAIQEYPDFKASLQEKYQQILVDEYQDTNPIQAQLLIELGDNPVNEQNPNLFVVGDDNQAIFAFQGADYSNLLDFRKQYPKAKVVSLTQNYRSHQKVLDFAWQVSQKIIDQVNLPDLAIDRELQASLVKNEAPFKIERWQVPNELLEYQFVADKIKALVEAGENPDEIAIIAPRHACLMEMAKFLSAADLAIDYEQKSNVLTEPFVQNLLDTLRLLVTVQEGRPDSEALVRFLSQPQFEISPETMWQFISEFRLQTKPLLEFASQYAPSLLIARLSAGLISLAARLNDWSVKRVIDVLLGEQSLELTDGDSDTEEYRFPSVVGFWFNNLPTQFRAYSALVALYDQLLDPEGERYDNQIYLVRDFLATIDRFEASGQVILDPSLDFNQNQSVSLLTIHKAKGLEFKHVFLISLSQSIWQPASRGSLLPKSLSFVGAAWASPEDYKRNFYVALTRAKTHLYLTSHLANLKQSAVRPFGLLEEDPEQRISPLLGAESQTINQLELDPETQQAEIMQALETSWRTEYVNYMTADRQVDYLRKNLRLYKLSATDMVNFVRPATATYTDNELTGAQKFFFDRFFRFPSNQSLRLLVGNSVHTALEEIVSGRLLFTDPKAKEVGQEKISKYFYKWRNWFDQLEFDLAQDQAKAALEAYLDNEAVDYQKFEVYPEFNLGDLQVEVKLDGHKIPVVGLIDRLMVDAKNKQLFIVDYKTGSASSLATIRNKLKGGYLDQVYFYKIALESSQKFADYQVVGAEIHFLEADPELIRQKVDFKPEREQQIKQQMLEVYTNIKAVNLDYQPDESSK